MKLTTNQIIDLFKAHDELRGAKTVVIGDDGKKRVVAAEPYPMSEKVKWNAAKNRTILKRFVVANDELNQDALAVLQAAKNAQTLTFRDEKDPKVKAEKQATAMAAVQAVVDQMNAEALKIGRLVQDVEGLLTMPASGFCLKTSAIDPVILSELMVLIDGEPDFEDKPTK